MLEKSQVKGDNMAVEKPKGVRQNNPGNLEWGSPWQGLDLSKKSESKRFCWFTDPAFGVRAIAVTLTTYYDKRKAKDGSKIDTIREVVERWAPGVEKGNNTSAYANNLSRLVGLDPDDESLNLHDYDTMFAMVSGIIGTENGFNGPLKGKTANTWYSDDVVEEGLRRAGIVKPKKAVDQTTTIAAGTAVLGAAQLVEVIQPVKEAVHSASGDLSSGDYARIFLGVATVGIGLYLGYIRYRKFKAGA